MNPRDFLRKPGYPFALLTTYSFDPYFFERLVLPDIWAGGSNSILVLVDQGKLRNALNSHIGDLRHLGRRYFIQPVEWRGAFHPKIFLRLRDEGGLAWVGSNNLTRGGWGGNSELGSAWRLDREGLDGCGWLTGLISYIDSTTTGLAKDLVYKVQRLPWLEDIPGESKHDVLISLEEPIGVQVERRWAGRRFTSLKILTGSTDRDAGFLHWATETFGLENIDICLTPECASPRSPSIGRPWTEIADCAAIGAEVDACQVLLVQRAGRTWCVMGIGQLFKFRMAHPRTESRSHGGGGYSRTNPLLGHSSGLRTRRSRPIGCTHSPTSGRSRR